MNIKSAKKQKPRNERVEMPHKHLQEYPFISRIDYMRLTNLGRDMAIKDLNSFIAEGWIKKYGLGRTVVYLLA